VKRCVGFEARAVHLGIGGLCVLIVLAGCGRSGSEGTAPSAPAAAVLGSEDVFVVKRTDIAAGVRFTGTLDPRDIVEIKAQVGGTIRDLKVDRGDAVKRAQPLARIEAEGIRGEAAGARASIAAANAGLAEARQRLAGARQLYDAGALSAVDFRGEQARFESAQSQLASARAQFAGASESARRASIVSAIDGVVSERDVNEGEAVSIGQKLLTIVNSKVLTLTGQTTVQAASQVRVGLPVTFTLDAYPGREFTGKIARVDPVADPATRRVGVTMELPNPGGELIGGQFVTGTILTGAAEKGLLVPEIAVRGPSSAPFVRVVEGDHVARRAVSLGTQPIESNYVEIASGLREGDRVIVTPATNLAEGTKVRLSASQPRQGEAR
jgi:membrane fusion protein, multidrug efflux system